MKIYVVTSGTYSSYGIDAVFTDPEKAKQYANLNSEREIEEYESDPVEIKEPHSINVGYIISGNHISFIETDPYFTKEGYDGYCFKTNITLNERLLKDIKENGKKSELLLKVLQDKWCEYKEAHYEEVAKEDKPDFIVLPQEEVVKAFAVKAALINSQLATKDKEKNT